jgi:glycosyltransferase involved in cell wall biosynthesis
MRIGLLVYGLDRAFTGIGRYTLELARALRALPEGPEVVLLTAGGPGPLAGENGLRRVSLPGCRLLPTLITLGNGWIPLLARRLRLDLVHDPTGVTPLLFGASGARTVVTVHDVFPRSCPGTSTLLDSLIYSYWLPRVLPRVDVVITDSQVSKMDISRYLEVASSRISVIHLGVNASYQPVSHDPGGSIRSRYGLPDHYLLFLGSAGRRKNLAGLLNSYALLKKMGDVPPLVVVGAKSHQKGAIIQTIEELNVAEHVIITGYVPGEDLPALYSGADLFVFPSLYEGFGLPPLEAMACGTPVVCSNAGSLPEVVGQAAIMVDPHDMVGLAEAMQRVLANPDLRHELREKGLARAQGFTWERCARETLAVYQKVAT